MTKRVDRRRASGFANRYKPRTFLGCLGLGSLEAEPKVGFLCRCPTEGIFSGESFKEVRRR